MDALAIGANLFTSTVNSPTATALWTFSCIEISCNKIEGKAINDSFNTNITIYSLTKLLFVFVLILLVSYRGFFLILL